MNWLLERLRKHVDDRGMMSNLRCVLVDNKKHRAWPALNRLGVEINDEIASFISGLYATHPEVAAAGNFGSTCKSICKSIAQKRGDKRSDDSKLTPIERRFQHVLAAEDRVELFGRVLRMVRMAKSQDVPVNYAKLATDLKDWSDRVKTEWAVSFWAQGTSPPTGEDS